MTYKTLAQIRSEIKRACDIEEEDFTSDTEILDYINEAIDEAESEIHNLCEDYFLTSASLALVSGTSSYSLPTDIYADKVRAIIYSNGSTVYPIKRIRDMGKFEKLSEISAFGSAMEYQYVLQNASATAGVKVVFYPASRETSSSNATIWYIRNANALSADADKCDIPEAYRFVVQYVKVRIYEKEGNPNLPFAEKRLMDFRKQMISTLANRVPDNDDTVLGDFSHYEEHN